MNYIEITAEGRVLGGGSVVAVDHATLSAAMPGRTLIEVAELPTDMNDVYWDGTAVVQMPPQPTPKHKFDFASKNWGDPRTIEQMRSDRWEIIKRARAVAELSGFSVAGVGRFDSDEVSQQRITGATTGAQMAIAANQPFGVSWTLADNSVVNLNAAEMSNVGLALLMHVSGTHELGRGLRDQINAATTLAEVDAVQWPPSA